MFNFTLIIYVHLFVFIRFYVRLFSELNETFRQNVDVALANIAIYSCPFPSLFLSIWHFPTLLFEFCFQIFRSFYVLPMKLMDFQ